MEIVCITEDYTFCFALLDEFRESIINTLLNG